MDQTHEIAWGDGMVPVSMRFDDPFYSLDDGFAETQHVFIAGNDLPARFTPGFRIAELGFGTGLNFLAALAAFRSAGIPGRLHFTSFEAFPLAMSDLRAALAPFDTLPREILTEAGESLPPHITGADFDLTLVFGDARDTLARWPDQADAWFLDGFSPARNPELWEAALLTEVARHTAPGGTLATYTAAGAVRRALGEAGFTITRVPGFGRKRHMTTGHRP